MVQVDYYGFDDAGMLWWDPSVSGEDEAGHVGAGLYRYATEQSGTRSGSSPRTVRVDS